jgi:hypothetical protein
VSRRIAGKRRRLNRRQVAGDVGAVNEFDEEAMEELREALDSPEKRTRQVHFPPTLITPRRKKKGRVLIRSWRSKWRLYDSLSLDIDVDVPVPRLPYMSVGASVTAAAAFHVSTYGKRVLHSMTAKGISVSLNATKASLGVEVVGTFPSPPTYVYRLKRTHHRELTEHDFEGYCFLTDFTVLGKLGLSSRNPRFPVDGGGVTGGSRMTVFFGMTRRELEAIAAPLFMLPIIGLPLFVHALNEKPKGVVTTNAVTWGTSFSAGSRKGGPVLDASITSAYRLGYISRVARQRYHVVRPGDTFWEIAEKHYGSGQTWKRIQLANKNLDGTLIEPTRLQVGEVLVIPESR